MANKVCTEAARGKATEMYQDGEPACDRKGEGSPKTCVKPCKQQQNQKANCGFPPCHLLWWQHRAGRKKEAPEPCDCWEQGQHPPTQQHMAVSSQLPADSGADFCSHAGITSATHLDLDTGEWAQPPANVIPSLTFILHHVLGASRAEVSWLISSQPPTSCLHRAKGPESTGRWSHSGSDQSRTLGKVPCLNDHSGSGGKLTHSMK